MEPHQVLQPRRCDRPQFSAALHPFLSSSLRRVSVRWNVLRTASSCCTALTAFVVPCYCNTFPFRRDPTAPDVTIAKGGRHRQKCITAPVHAIRPCVLCCCLCVGEYRADLCCPSLRSPLSPPPPSQTAHSAVCHLPDSDIFRILRNIFRCFRNASSDRMGGPPVFNNGQPTQLTGSRCTVRCRSCRSCRSEQQMPHVCC